MYTAARPPTPALCIEVDQSDVESLNDDVEDAKEEELEITECSKQSCNTGRIMVGRWGRSKLSRRSSDPPEVIVNQARLHTRPHKPPIQFQASSCKRTKLKEPKKVDKKIQNELSKPVDDEEVESDDGRLIASKVLPIMAMLLQRNEREESDEEKKKSEIQQNTTIHLQPKLSVQCIQLLPSEPVTSRRH
ncbi:unnamed protein product [Nezara viridula]|uniref:Uncharacterized protein n=1 Tax=Nezara viridula TaxID=85310 RepID=A0A9P0H4Q6_NEZVI|nr:unnamed protein product [Nezara viridula]